jgi:uncharacterized protein (DUF697 family)
MKSLVEKIVDRASVVAAGLGAVMSPLPFADEALMLPVLGVMTVKIGHAHGLRWRELPWRPIAKTALGGILARATLNLSVAYVPIVAAATNAASAATLTGAFGAYADRVCADPRGAHAETLEEFKVDVRDIAGHWRRLFTRGASMNTNSMPSPSEDVRQSIDHALHTRHFGRGEVLFKVEDRAKSAGSKVWEFTKAHPYAGIAAISAVGLAAASMVGVGEIVVAGLFGYGAWEVLRRGEPVQEAAKDVVREAERFV